MKKIVISILAVIIMQPMSFAIGTKSTMGKMTPTAIETQLQVIMCMKHTPGFNPNALIDSYFQQAAKKAGKPILGFETVDFQISVLYTGTSIERQKEQLLCMIDNPEYTLEIMKSITNAYFSQDMEAVLAVSEEKSGDACDSTPEENEVLIYGRNADWVKKMPAIMENESTLFVVGAAHLSGERGVLELLKKNGYVVEAVK